MKFIGYVYFFFIFFQHSYAYTHNPSALDEVIQQLPEWKVFSQEMQIEKIETGMTNHNFKLIFPTRSYFIRLGNNHPNLLRLDQEREYFCAKAASELGIAPTIILYSPQERIMVMPFIDSEPLQKDSSTYNRITQTLRQLHDSGKQFPTTFCPYEEIGDYYEKAKALRNNRPIPLESYILHIVENIRKVIPRFKKLCPCHLDLYQHNFLDDGKKIWVVDWEYSAMADPICDLAIWASSDNFSLDEMQEILDLYFGSSTSTDLAHLYLMSILADLRWHLWCLIQAEVSTIKEKYLNYADFYLDHALKKIEHPQYEQSLAVMRNDQ